MKARVTVSLDRDLLRAAERRSKGRSRSQVIEEALRIAERLAVARATVEYYRSLRPDEREEEASWGEIASIASGAAWHQDDV